eukprot:GHVP01043786.1.p1 GENE.GHVP01043786.1~~GHVP01043786.1.p1  ORF type:complete len:520 (-),score=79.00 GHVP01043786.1:1526-2938(-)
MKILSLKEGEQGTEIYLRDFRREIAGVENISPECMIAYFINGLKPAKKEYILRYPPSMWEELTLRLQNMELAKVQGDETEEKMDLCIMKKETRKCFNCGKIGHLAAKCYKGKKKHRKGELNEVNEMGDDEINFNPVWLNLAKNNNNLLTLQGCIRGIEVEILIDSGTSSNFIGKRVVRIAGISTIKPRARKFLQLGDGKKIEVQREVEDMSLRIGDQTEKFKATVIESERCYDLILGKTWLSKWNPRIDWRNNRIFRSIKSLPKQGKGCSGASEGSDLGDNEKTGRSLEIKTGGCSETSRGSCPGGMKASVESLADKIKDLKLQQIETKCGMEKHKIETGDAEPIAIPLRRTSKVEQEEVRRQLDDLWSKGLIRESTSEWSAPIVFAKKKNGKLRMWIDYRKINAVTKKAQALIQRIDETLERIGKATIFSSLDLESGYHQIPMNEENIEKTAFSTRYGLFEHLVMPFGL